MPSFQPTRSIKNIKYYLKDILVYKFIIYKI
jgi:hypothetical protein